MHLGHPDAHMPGHELSDGVVPPLRRRTIIVGVLLAAAAAWGALWLHHWSSGRDQPVVPGWAMTPFVLLLGCIATMPFAAPHWWERNYARVSIALFGDNLTNESYRLSYNAGAFGNYSAKADPRTYGVRLGYKY